MTKKGSFLNGSTRGPQYLKAFGFPIKDFGHDKKYYKGALPPYKPPKEKSMKTKEKDQK